MAPSMSCFPTRCSNYCKSISQKPRYSYLNIFDQTYNSDFFSEPYSKWCRPWWRGIYFSVYLINKWFSFSKVIQVSQETLGQSHLNLGIGWFHDASTSLSPTLHSEKLSYKEDIHKENLFHFKFIWSLYTKITKYFSEKY